MFSQYSTKCGKLFFLSKADAESKIVEREADRNSEWLGRAYLCSDCHYWHIATVGKANARKKEEEQRHSEAKKRRNLEIQKEKADEERRKAKLEKIKRESAVLRRMAAKNLKKGTAKKKKGSSSKSKKDYNFVPEENEVIESFGESSKNSIFDSLDSEILAKLKEKI